MEEWQRLAQAYMNDEVERKESCAMNIQQNMWSIKDDIRFPISIEFRNVLYLAYGRNAWQSTWINRYYPGSISVSKSSLQELAEKRRVQGSVFRIEARPSLMIKFKTRNLVLVALNRGHTSDYSALLSEIKPFDLRAFWLTFLCQFWQERPNFLVVLNLVQWRPDLWHNNDHSFVASSRGSNRHLAWTRSNSDSVAPLFHDFREKFSGKALSLK